MPRRFAEVRFNLMRAIELLGDMNHDDMDVTAPPSDETFFKEHEVASRLNDCLTQLIEEGVFEDCEPRELEESDDEGSVYEYGSQESEGFNYGPDSERASKESLTGLFRRYVRRMLPGGGRSRRHEQDEPEGGQSGTETEAELEDDEDVDEYDEGVSSAEGSSRRSGASESSVSGTRRSASTRQSSVSGGSRRLGRSSRSRALDNPDRERSASSRRSASGSHRERSGSEPYDPNVVYEHRHYHKHNHPGSHHHHQHDGSHLHAYHVHNDDASNQEEQMSDENRSFGGISNAFGASYTDSQGEDDDLRSSRRSSRARSGSSSRRGRSNQRRRQSRGRSSSRGSR